MNRFIILLILFVPAVSVTGQVNQADSLRLLLNQADESSTKFEIASELFKLYYRANLDSAETYFYLIQDLSKKENKKEWQLTTHLFASQLLWKKGQLDSVLFHTLAHNKLAEDLDENVKYIEGLKRLSTLYDAMGRMDTSLVIAKVAYQKVKQISDWNAISKIQLRLGNLFYRMAEYDQALIYYQKVDSTLKSNNEINEELALALSNIGLIYTYLKNPEALNYFDQCKNIYQQLDHPEGVISAETSKAVHYAEEEKYDKAIPLYRKSFEFYSNYGDLRKLVSTAIQLGNCYLNTNNGDSAIFFCEKAAQLAAQLDAPSLLGQSQTSLGLLYYKLNEFGQSILYYQKALRSYQKLGVEYTIEERSNLYEGLYQSYRAQSDHENAYASLDKYLNLNDSMILKQNSKLTQELETKYRNKKKQEEIELLTAQNQLASQQKRNQLIVFIGIASALLILSAFLFVLYRNRQKTNQKLKELDKAKSNFFANISHEFRTPLTLIKNPVEDQLAAPDLSEAGRKRMELIGRNADRLLSLVDELLDLARLDAGSMRLKVKEAAISTLMKALVPTYEYAATKKGLRFYTHLPEESIQGWCDPDVLEKVIANLLGNAIKYTAEDGEIECALSSNREEAVIRVKNTISKEQHVDAKQIFERFYRADENEQGAGIGLALVKELVALHHGTIRLEQEKDQISFEVRIPIQKRAYAKEEMGSALFSETYPGDNTIMTDTNYTTDSGQASPIDKNEPLLLIVEDNEELAELIQEQFKAQYQVLMAKNGKEGIAVATKYIPDLIISDVMMPLTDGIELAATLKTDERTSHIPIILLTAKVEDKDQLRGIETGADDYLTKPFNKEVLSARVQHLIEERAKLRKKYSQEVVLHPKGIAITSADELFLQKLQDIIDHRLTDSAFNAEAFSQAVNMSRMQLHRKLKGLLGITATEFIRTERLKMAAHLLKHSNVGVSEVGYAVGFNDPSYFAKCFKEVYGTSPKVFAEEQLRQPSN